MSYTRHILFSFLCISTVSLTMEQSYQNNYSHKNPKLQPLYPSKKTEFFEEPFNNHSSSFLEQSHYSLSFNEHDIKELELVLNYAPDDALTIINHLKDPSFLDRKSYRASIFYGQPGTGKSTIAKAIAYKMQKDAGWKNQFIPSTSLIGEYRNQTTVHLNTLFKKITQSTKPQLLIIDEFNQLLENDESESYDTDGTSKAIWMFLDQQAGNHNFFLIGITNRIDKFPQALKSRIRFRCIAFESSMGTAIRNTIFRNRCTSQFCQLDASIDDDYLTEQLTQLQNCVGRDLDEFAGNLKSIYRRHDKISKIMIITKEHFAEALQEDKKTCKVMKYNEARETEEERRHKENIEIQKKGLALQKKHFIQQQQEQRRLHEENKTMQQLHFVQQQKIQLAIADNQYSHSPATGFFQQNGILKKGKDEVDLILTSEQKQLYANITTVAPNVTQASFNLPNLQSNQINTQSTNTTTTSQTTQNDQNQANAGCIIS